MNPHAAKSISPLILLGTLKTHRNLIYNLVKRKVIGRYRGSIMGLLWSFFNPILMLANVNYVKKVVFPLEILPVVAIGSAAFHFLVSLLVWLIFYLIYFGIPQATLLLFPLVLIPFFLLTLGLSWFLAALGVYLRDASQIIGVMTTALMFLSPIFYPITALPQEYHLFLQINPLTFVIEQARDVMIWGKGMNWSAWAIYLLLAAIMAWLGFAWFQKTRKGFANVL